jgi:hypothetical protein
MLSEYAVVAYMLEKTKPCEVLYDISFSRWMICMELYPSVRFRH